MPCACQHFTASKNAYIDWSVRSEMIRALRLAKLECTGLRAEGLKAAMRSELHSRTHPYLSVEHKYSWGPEHMDVPERPKVGFRKSCAWLRWWSSVPINCSEISLSDSLLGKMKFVLGNTHRKVHVFSSAKNNIYFINFGRELSQSKSINLSEIFEIA